ncbi:MAG: tetratricopeptide repeat protein, partial [Planctomycetes bacterium]|nr:tetratricopeptide repeat protein [Planctomycetota bacterium]
DLALSLFKQVLKGCRRVLGEEHLHSIQAQRELAICLAKQKAYAKAEPMLLDAYQRYVKVLGAKHPSVVTSIRYLVDLYERWGKPEEAAKWKAKLPPVKKPDKKAPDKKKIPLGAV